MPLQPLGLPKIPQSTLTPNIFCAHVKQLYDSLDGKIPAAA
jgi:hypothetical protein